MSSKITTSTRIPITVLEAMNKQILLSGYSMRNKSKWICEAIEAFLKVDDFCGCVDMTSEMENVSSVLTIRIPRDLYEKINFAAAEVRKEYPMLEGVKSNIIRGGIVQKLIRDSGPGPERISC